MPLVDASRLERGIAATFAAAGATRREADLIARHLVEASLRGHDSHGVGLLVSYLEAVGDGRMVLGRPVTVVRDLGALLVCDAGNGAGQVMAHEAMELGIARARAHGLCVVALRDAHHVGRIGHWAEQCAEAGLVSLHFANVPRHAAVAAFGGTAPRLGTNPFAAAFPRPGGDPVVVDFATSRWAVGKVRVAQAKGETLPEGILLDADGRPTVDPSLLFASPAGALLPFGEHKGFGLALACELLAGALTGGATQDGSSAVGVTNSMLSVLLQPESFDDAPAYAARLEALATWMAGDRREGRDTHLPGDPERATRASRLASGLPVEAPTWTAMVAAAGKLGVRDLGG
jgi:hydroxycarboxylate dehydrogenase B